MSAVPGRVAAAAGGNEVGRARDKLVRRYQTVTRGELFPFAHVSIAAHILGRARRRLDNGTTQLRKTDDRTGEYRTRASRR